MVIITNYGSRCCIGGGEDEVFLDRCLDEEDAKGGASGSALRLRIRIPLPASFENFRAQAKAPAGGDEAASPSLAAAPSVGKRADRAMARAMERAVAKVVAWGPDAEH